MLSNCPDCGLEKELTRHGTCFRCHVGSVAIKGSPKPCKNCQSATVVKRNVQTKATLREV